MRKSSRQKCEIRVVDAVGVVVTPSLILDVSPKIPSPHLLYLLERAELLPRLSTGRATLAADRTLLELIAHWYVIALGRLLKKELARDYRSSRSYGPVVRGRLLVVPTTQRYYRGHAGVVSEYQDFDLDTPLNRLLLHAARLLRSHPDLPESIKASARRAILQMDGIGALREGDMQAQPDQHTLDYGDAAMLAKQLIEGTGRGLVVGEKTVWTFLMRTPEAVEKGLRLALGEALPSVLAPVKRSFKLTGTDLELKSDLLFAEHGLAEVKYKTATHIWKRDDLYQLVAFATGLEVTDAAIIDFASTARPRLASLPFGKVRVAHLSWPALPQCTPSAALERLAAQIVEWASTWSPP